MEQLSLKRPAGSTSRPSDARGVSDRLARVEQDLAALEAQQATLSKAATMLQKMWRGRIARREMEKKKSVKGGKGGKKKK